MSEIAMGNLYDLNKQLMVKELPLSKDKIKEKEEEISNFFVKNNSYFMLLCHERRDYTIFRLRTPDYLKSLMATKELLTCLNNRGKILSIDKEDNNNAYAFWLVIDDEAFCYYLFPYDEAVIEV